MLEKIDNVPIVIVMSVLKENVYNTNYYNT